MEEAEVSVPTSVDNIDGLSLSGCLGCYGAKVKGGDFGRRGSYQ